jgi:hypothetical protein
MAEGSLARVAAAGLAASRGAKRRVYIPAVIAGCNRAAHVAPVRETGK